MTDFLFIAWPALLTLLGLLGLVGWGIREHRRTHRRGRYRTAAPPRPQRGNHA